MIYYDVRGKDAGVEVVLVDGWSETPAAFFAFAQAESKTAAANQAIEEARRLNEELERKA